MKEAVYLISDNIISSLGFTSEENIKCLKLDSSGIKLIDNQELYNQPFYGSLVDTYGINSRFSQYSDPSNYTRFEKLIILSICDALKNSDIDVRNDKTLIIISTTKGNIELLNTRYSGKIEKKRAYLWKAADVIQRFFNNPNTPIVISNACISGVLAIIVGAHFVKSKQYDNVIISGADVITEFIVAGFQSFQSLCDGPCKPFDINRNGLSLGEGSGTIILSNNQNNYFNSDAVLFAGGSTGNDANHISGPSRTGEGLFTAVKKTIEEAKNIGISKVDHISAHGTATQYNDEMEAIVFDRANLSDIPISSLKGFWGHTLGAAGIIESVAAVHSLKSGFMIKTLGMDKLGVSKNITVVDKYTEQTLNSCLKTSSGFGGCNAAVLFSKAHGSK